MKDDSLVYLDRVSKIYGSQRQPVYAVQSVTLDVKPGEFYSLLGSSGSGKTTTLRLIGGFEVPDYGQVFIGGDEVTTQPPYRRNVHTVFQSYALFPHLSVAENIAYPLTIAGVPRLDRGDRVQESLRMFRLDGLSDRRPAQLSGGQQQRVALARALISRPKVLLLDEPLSALDAKIRQEVRQELRDLQRQTNLTFIYVTHDQEEALALSDRIAVMHQGRVDQVGTPQEIYDRPASPFVAQFIGKANLLQGTLLETQAGIATVDIQSIRVRAIAPTPSLAPGSRITLMVRPERIQVDPPHPLDNQTSGPCLNTTYIGQLLESSFETPLGRLRVTQLSGHPTALSHPTHSLSWQVADGIVIADQSPAP